MIVFVLLVFFGSGNAVLNKLSAIPMYNYPNFLNLWGTLIYIPLCFGYIWPMIVFGSAITPDQLKLSKRPFAIMGALDCMASIMQTFCAVYLPGTLLVLLPQAAIPISILLSKQLLSARYTMLQYVGAWVVLMGIVVVMEPVMTGRQRPDYVCTAIVMEHDCTICQSELDKESCLSHRLDINPSNLIEEFFETYWQTFTTNATYDDNDDDEGQPICQWVNASLEGGGDNWSVVIWSCIMIASCIPMTLSSIYKEIALDDDLDPIYLNGWIAVFQLFFSILLAVPAGLASAPVIQPSHVPKNIWDGFKCYLGEGTIDTGCHPDDHCHDHAGVLVNINLFFNIGCTLCMMYVLKYGSASLLYLALTAMVPIGNLAFCLLPQASTFHLSDILGLLVIMVGLVLYRCADPDNPHDTILVEEPQVMGFWEENHTSKAASLTQPLLSGVI